VDSLKKRTKDNERVPSVRRGGRRKRGGHERRILSGDHGQNRQGKNYVIRREGWGREEARGSFILRERRLMARGKGTRKSFK